MFIRIKWVFHDWVQGGRQGRYRWSGAYAESFSGSDSGQLNVQQNTRIYAIT